MSSIEDSTNINALIAERVMGWTLKAKDPVAFPLNAIFHAHWWFNASGHQVHRDVDWDPWRSLDDAFEVFAKLPLSWKNLSQLSNGKWVVKKWGDLGTHPDCQEALIEPVDTLPGAICMAVIKMVMVRGVIASVKPIQDMTEAEFGAAYPTVNEARKLFELDFEEYKRRYGFTLPPLSDDAGSI